MQENLVRRLFITLGVYVAAILAIFAIWKFHIRLSAVLGLSWWLYVPGGFAATVIGSWVIGIRMRRRIREDLGQEPTALDLADIDTWMKVDSVETEKAAKDPPIS